MDVFNTSNFLVKAKQINNASCSAQGCLLSCWELGLSNIHMVNNFPVQQGDIYHMAEAVILYGLCFKQNV